jgi:hypothetical protein
MLLSRNEELPRDFRLKENAFQMTTFIFDDIQAKTDSKLNMVRTTNSVLSNLILNFSRISGLLGGFRVDISRHIAQKLQKISPFWHKCQLKMCHTILKLNAREKD